MNFFLYMWSLDIFFTFAIFHLSVYEDCKSHDFIIFCYTFIIATYLLHLHNPFSECYIVISPTYIPALIGGFAVYTLARHSSLSTMLPQCEV